MVKKIKKIIADYADVDINAVSNEMHLMDDLYLDEDDINEIMAELTEEFEVEFDEEECDFVYVSDLISYVIQNC